MLVYLSVGIFVGFVMSIMFITLMPNLTIKCLESFRLFKKGSLKIYKSSRNMGAGSKQGKNITYMNGRKVVNLKVVGLIMLINCSFFGILSVLLFVLVSNL